MNQNVENSNVSWPNFLVIGAAKAGTTALYSHLRQHPEVYMPRHKEPNFFALHGNSPDFSAIRKDDELYQASVNLFNRIKSISVDDMDSYRQLFSGVAGEKAIGEASTLYLFHPGAAACIKQHIPDVKLVVVFRNPVDRAFSSYLHMVRIGREVREFREALSQEPVESENVWCARGDFYIRPGFYARQLRCYLDLFDKGQIKIYLYEDFKRDPQGMVRDLYRFIGVDETFKQDLSKKHNVSGIPKNRYLYQLSRTVNRRINSSSLLKGLSNSLPKNLRSRIRTVLFESSLKRPQISTADRDWLVETYRSDILELQGMIERDLSAWITHDMDSAVAVRADNIG